MAQVYDEKKEKVSDDDLRRITGIHVGEEDQMKAAARDSLGGKESQTAETTKEDGKEGSAPKELAAAEAGSGGLYNPAGRGEPQRQPLWKRLKTANNRRKAAAGLGVGTIGALVIGFMTVAPVFRIPSLMSGIVSKVAGETKDVVEDTAQRQIITYLLWRAGATPTDYVIDKTILGSVFATFRTNKLEDKIFRRTGLKIVNDNGRIILTHDGTDLKERVNNYDDVMKLLESPDLTDLDRRELKKTMKTIVRTVVPAWRFHLTGKFSRWLKIKYKLPSYAVRPYDESKDKVNNVEAFKRDQINTVSKNNLNDISKAFDCLFEDNCSYFSEDNKPTEVRNELEGKHEGTVEQIEKDIQASAVEATEEAVKDKKRGGFSEKLFAALFKKILPAAAAVTATAAIPFVGPVNGLAVIAHVMQTALNNDLALKIPAIMVGNALGSMYGQWQGFADGIKAHKVNLAFIQEMNAQTHGVNLAKTYNYAYKGEAKGVPVDTRVNDNLDNPIGGVFAASFNVFYYTIGLPLIFWYATVSQVLSKVGDLGSEAVTAYLEATGAIKAFNEAMAVIFGPDWQERIAQFCTQTILSMLGIMVDPLAKGAKLFNQLYTGADLAFNTYLRLVLGGRATSAKHDVKIDEKLKSITVSKSSPGMQFIESGSDVEGLPLKERLFSIDEPKSLLSQLIRAVPDSPGQTFSAIIGQIARLPSTLLTAISGKSLAITNTPEDDAAIDGVRQYGFTFEERNREIPAEVRLMPPETECPEVDQEKESNVCMAHKAVAQSLMCWPAGACPAFEGN